MAFTPLSGITSSTKPTSSFTPITSAPAPAAAPAPQGFFSKAVSSVESFGSDVIGGIKTATSDVFHALTAPGPTIGANPLKEAADTAGTAVFKSLTDAGQQMIDGVSGVFDSHQSALQRGVDVGDAAFGALNAAFAPVTAAITYAQHIPGVAPLATGLNNIFAALGVGGSDLAEGAVDTLPISDSAKETVMPLAKDIGALAAQIIAGEAGPKVFHDIAGKSKTLVDTVVADAGHAVAGAKALSDVGPVRELPVQGASEATPVPFENDYRTAEDINAGKPAKPSPSELPTIQADAPAPRKVAEDLSVEPIQDTVPKSESVAAPETAPAAPPEAPAAPKSSTEAAPPLKTEPGVSKIGKSIEVKAVDAKLTDAFDKTAGYDTITIKDQAERATKLVNENFDDARAVLRGDKPLPEGLKGTALITAAEEHLEKYPDADLAYELANSPLVSGTSEAAQEMRLAAERVPDSITAKFREVKAAREAALEKKGGMSKQVKKVVDDVQKEIRKAASKRPDWDSFIADLTCKV